MRIEVVCSELGLDQGVGLDWVLEPEVVGLGRREKAGLGESQSLEVEHRLVRRSVDLVTRDMLVECLKSILQPTMMSSTYLQVL